MKGLKRLVLGMVLLGGAAPANAEIITLEAAPGHGFRERVGEARPVSSAAVVGMLVLHSSEKSKERLPGNEIYAYFPNGAASDDRIQFEMESADGIYRGQGEFRGQVPARSWARLRLRDQDRPFQWPPRAGWTDIAVSIHLLSAGPPTRSTRLIASIDSDPAAATLLRLHINSRGGQIASTDAAHCRPVQSPSVVAFDHACELPLRLGEVKSAGMAQIKLLRLEGFGQDDVIVDLPAELIGAHVENLQ